MHGIGNCARGNRDKAKLLLMVVRARDPPTHRQAPQANAKGAAKLEGVWQALNCR